jgi:hypothetical protein
MPKENKTDKAARLRERRITDLERSRATEQSATSLTTDLRAIYGFRGLPMMIGSIGNTPAPKGAFTR